MEIEQLRNEVLCVLKDVLEERDYAAFVLKIVAGMSNTQIARVTKQTESNVRRRFKDIIFIELNASTAYIYEDGELIDTIESGEMIETTARFRNAKKALLGEESYEI